MRRLIIFNISILMVVLASSFTPAHAQAQTLSQNPAVEVPPQVNPFNDILPLEKVAPGKFRLGEILIDKTQRTITFPAQVNMDKGMLEYLIVHTKGKTHESLLRTKVEPYYLQLVFLLLGFEGTSQPLSGQGAPEKPLGEKIDISFSTVKGKVTTTVRAEEWLALRTAERYRNVEKVDWTFTGSYVDLGRLIAQEIGSVAAVYHDPGSLIDNASPGGESDEIWFVKEGIVPPVGTPVTVSIKPQK